MINTNLKQIVKDVLLDESSPNVIKMGRVKLIKFRIRKGKIEKRKKVSAVKGFTYRGGRLVRISALEKRHRIMGARRGKFRRKAQLTRTKFKIKRSLLRRKILGIR